MSSNERAPDRGRRWGIGLMVFFAMAVFLIIGMLMAIAVHAPEQLPRIEAFVKAAKPWAIATQVLVALLVWLHWARIVHWLARTGRIREAGIGPFLAFRHRVAILLLVMVLTLTAGLPFSLLASSSGG